MGYILSAVRELPSSANVLLFESMVLLRIVYEYFAFKFVRVLRFLFAIQNCSYTTAQRFIYILINLLFLHYSTVYIT